MNPANLMAYLAAQQNGTQGGGQAPTAGGNGQSSAPQVNPMMLAMMNMQAAAQAQQQQQQQGAGGANPMNMFMPQQMQAAQQQLMAMMMTNPQVAQRMMQQLMVSMGQNQNQNQNASRRAAPKKNTGRPKKRAKTTRQSQAQSRTQMPAQAPNSMLNGLVGLPNTAPAQIKVKTEGGKKRKNPGDMELPELPPVKSEPQSDQQIADEVMKLLGSNTPAPTVGRLPPTNQSGAGALGVGSLQAPMPALSKTEPFKSEPEYDIPAEPKVDDVKQQLKAWQYSFIQVSQSNSQFQAQAAQGAKMIEATIAGSDERAEQALKMLPQWRVQFNFTKEICDSLDRNYHIYQARQIQQHYTRYAMNKHAKHLKEQYAIKKRYQDEAIGLKHKYTELLRHTPADKHPPVRARYAEHQQKLKFRYQQLLQQHHTNYQRKRLEDKSVMEQKYKKHRLALQQAMMADPKVAAALKQQMHVQWQQQQQSMQEWAQAQLQKIQMEDQKRQQDANLAARLAGVPLPTDPQTEAMLKEAFKTKPHAAQFYKEMLKNRDVLKELHQELLGLQQRISMLMGEIRMTQSMLGITPSPQNHIEGASPEQVQQFVQVQNVYKKRLVEFQKQKKKIQDLALKMVQSVYSTGGLNKDEDLKDMPEEILKQMQKIKEDNRNQVRTLRTEVKKWRKEWMTKQHKTLQNMGMIPPMMMPPVIRRPAGTSSNPPDMPMLNPGQGQSEAQNDLLDLIVKNRNSNANQPQQAAPADMMLQHVLGNRSAASDPLTSQNSDIVGLLMGEEKAQRGKRTKPNTRTRKGKKAAQQRANDPDFVPGGPSPRLTTPPDPLANQTIDPNIFQQLVSEYSGASSSQGAPIDPAISAILNGPQAVPPKNSVPGLESILGSTAPRAASPPSAASVLATCRAVLDACKALPTAWPFLQPVDWKYLEIPEYPNIIQNPMDFETIQKKLDAGEVTTIAKFKELMLLVFQNAKTFNPEGHEVHEHAKDLETFFRKRLEKVAPGCGYSTTSDDTPTAAAPTGAQKTKVEGENGDDLGAGARTGSTSTSNSRTEVRMSMNSVTVSESFKTGETKTSTKSSISFSSSGDSSASHSDFLS